MIFQLIRKGKITFFDLIQGSSRPKLAPALEDVNLQAPLEDSVEALEFNLGKYINGIEIATQVARDSYYIDEQRKDAGIYDEALKFVHREFLPGAREINQLSAVQVLLEEYYALLQAHLNALVARGFITEDKLKEMLEAPVPPKFENGAKIVALAWSDPQFKSKLLQDAKQTLREMGIAVYRTPKLNCVRKYRESAQRDRMHALLVLPLRDPGESSMVV